jgi:hypothetical protein
MSATSDTPTIVPSIITSITSVITNIAVPALSPSTPNPPLSRSTPIPPLRPRILPPTRSRAGASGLGRPGIAGPQAARSPPAQRSVSLPRRLPPPGPARLRSRVCASITRSPAGGRVSGTGVHKGVGEPRFLCERAGLGYDLSRPRRQSRSARNKRGKAMKGLALIRRAVVFLTLSGFVLPQAEAMEIMGGPSPAADMYDGMVLKVQAQVSRGSAQRHAGRRPAHRPPVNRPPISRPPNRPPVHRPPVHRPPMLRPVHPIHRRGVWARPTWYRWSPGRAIAAGAAIGFVSAATAAAWAGAPPQANLCWYYTDPGRRHGFWDICP